MSRAHWNNIFGMFDQRFGQRLLWHAPFALLLMQLIAILPDRTILWGADSVLYRYGHADDFLTNALLRLYYAPELADTILILHAACCMFSFIPSPFALLPRILTWVTALMLYSAAPAAYGWTMPLLLGSTFVTIGFCLRGISFRQQPLRTWLHLSLRASAMLFLIAFGCLSWGNDQWLSGHTFYYAIHRDAFVRDWVIHNREWMVGMSGAITYACMLCVTLLPIALIVRKWRMAGWIIGTALCALYAAVFTNTLDALTLGVVVVLPWMYELRGSVAELQQT